jgi:hypothetical protein
MATTKDFDCVAFKRAAQEKIYFMPLPQNLWVDFGVKLSRRNAKGVVSLTTHKALQLVMGMRFSLTSESTYP